MKRLILLLLLAGLGYAGWVYLAPIQRLIAHYQSGASTSGPPRPQIERYEVLKTELASLRADLANRYRAARTPAARQSLHAEAAMLLDEVLPEMMRCWIGTPWDFYGTASQPGGDPIACGYFVSTVLLDAGFQVERYKLAQQPSMNIIETFVPKNRMPVTVGDSFEMFRQQMSQRPPGIYIVGLDTHVGFIENTASGLRYLHSSGGRPYHVVDEPPVASTSLGRSRYRVIGHLTGETPTLEKWLTGQPFKTVTR